MACIREPLLSGVVITRNEARHIATCLESLLKAVRDFPDAAVVVVDSNSTDGTVEIATRFPATVYRYHGSVRTAAAGRAVGTRLVSARYILFVDGDSCVEGAWLPAAVDVMERDGQVGAVFGRRREVYEGVPPDYRSTAEHADAGLGGNALYRRTALLAAGGFNPYLASQEEGELRGRVEAAGYTVVPMRELMITHYSVPRDTWRGQTRRLRRGMTKGTGQLLRAAIASGLFWYHARRLNRELIMLAYVLLGIAALLRLMLAEAGSVLEAWIGTGLLAFAGLWYRRRSLRGALYIVSEWVLGAIGVVAGFLVPLPDACTFAPTIELLNPQAAKTPPWSGRAVEQA